MSDQSAKTPRWLVIFATLPSLYALSYIPFMHGPLGERSQAEPIVLLALISAGLAALLAALLLVAIPTLLNESFRKKYGLIVILLLYGLAFNLFTARVGLYSTL